MSYSADHLLRKAKFTGRQVKAIVRVIEARTDGLLDKEDLETALAKLEVRILNRIYVAFAVQMGILLTLTLGLLSIK
jgi:hypothetical protein